MNAPVLLDGKTVSGAEGLTLAGVEDEILRGGRFVFYYYNFSLIILSFRRSSGFYFLKSGDDGVDKAFGYSLIALLFGPWGIPWGLFWTPLSIYRNLCGGKDITAPVLEAMLGSQRAAEVMATRRQPSAGWGMKALRLGFVAAPLLFIFALYLSFQALEASETKLAASPGYQAFKTAHQCTTDGLIQGNTTKAVTVAREIAKGMKNFLDESVTHSGSKTPPSHSCGVWCELREDRCVVLVRVPDLRHYDSKAQKILADATWMDSLASLQKLSVVKPGMSLAVGLRGDYLYETVMTGKLSADPEAMPEARIDSESGREKLIEWFR